MCLIESEQLGDTDEMGSLQIFETRESFIEILRQVENFLGHFNDLFFLRSGDLDQSLHNRVGDEGVALELLANLECYVKRADAHEGRSTST